MLKNKKLYIAVEGLDLTGKSTVCKRIINYIKLNYNRPVLFTARPNKEDEPGLTMYNEAKKEKYEDTMARYMLFAANNALNFNNNILPWLKENKNGIVLSDRFFISALAYNIIGTKLQNYIEEIIQLEECCADFNMPDICFYLYSAKKNLDPYNALEKRKDKLEPNDIKDKKFKLKLLKKYDEAIRIYNTCVPSYNYIKRINIDNPFFMKEIYSSIDDII